MKRLKPSDSPPFPPPPKPESITIEVDAEGRRWEIDQDGVAMCHTKTGYWTKIGSHGRPRFVRLF